MAADRLAFCDLSLSELAAYVDYPPIGTALREAVDGPVSMSAIETARIIQAVREVSWNIRGGNGAEGEPYPALVIPGLETAEEAKPEWTDEGIEEQLNNPALQAIMAGG
ncbi:hypothetical protein ACLQ3K_20120 [Tsukamurella sp. DT100]|uniref:hypothetical protein n=1 Tax=Tsukamurella sp. DT100 TaxID=3393415 RepID=UPI003CF9EE05